MSLPIQFDENASCDRCGRFGVLVFDGEKLCAECYEARGSCCPEFGGDDLTARPESPVEARPPL
jgi:hypothetical protein